MPRFHFNIKDGVDIPDLTGTEFESDLDARLEAVRLSGELLKANPIAFLLDLSWRLDVTDDVGSILLAIHISAVELPALAQRKPTLS